MSRETPIQKRILLTIGSRDDVRLFRNNNGVAVYPDGSRVKYGIANPGGSDLIGWHSRIITSADIGKRVALFVGLEVKSDSGDPTEDQLRFIRAVLAAGGIAAVVRSVAEASQALERGLFER